VLVEQYAGGDEAREIYPHWRGGYILPDVRGEIVGAAGRTLHFALVDPAKAAEFAAVYANRWRKISRPRLGEPTAKSANTSPPIDSGEPLPATVHG